MKAKEIAVISKLKSKNALQSDSLEFVEADLRGADLSGSNLGFINLSYARLDDSNLRGARLNNAILTGACLAGANLQESELRFVEATELDISTSDCRNMRWEHCNMISAMADKANFTNTVFRSCTLDSSSIQNADLTNVSIQSSTCDGTSFKSSILKNLETFGSDFNEADFTDAEQFYTSREIIVEILRRHVAHDIEQAKLIGAAQIMRHWCYSEWRNYLKTPAMKQYYAIGQEILSLYPKSGAYEALEVGWDWRQKSQDQEKS